MTDWLRHRARLDGRRPALVAGDERLTFADLEDRTARAASQLLAIGVAPGARVALLLRNGAPFVILTHALARVGAIMVPLNTRLAPAEIAWQVSDARPALLIHDDAFGAQAAAACGAAGARPVPLSRLSADAETPPPPGAEADLGSPQGIVYTSATSGRPKGVRLSFGNHWWSAVASALNLGLHRDDRWLAPLPLFHVGGLAIIWRSVIYGIPAVVQDTFDAEAANRAIEEDRITIASVVGPMLQRMLDARGHRPYPPSLRCVLLGGGPAPAPLLERCLSLGVPVAPTYGLTEAASQVTTLLPPEVALRLGSSGKPLFSTEVRIEHGEILVRGPTVMLGYADRPDETAQVMRDGWLHTGDVGYLDEEGYLYVQERRDDLIVTGGENVYPAEVEAVLLAHPSVADAGVVGLPDPGWGQIVAAAIRPRPGTQVSDEELQVFCRERLAGYKVPRRIWFADDLPRTPAGKLIRRALRAAVKP